MKAGGSPSVRQRLEHIGLLGLAQGVRHLSLPRLQALGRSLGRLWYRLDAPHRRVALENLDRAFDGRMSPAEIELLARNTFEHFGIMALEVCRLAFLEKEELLGWITIEGEEHFWKALAQGRGLLLLTGHLGNWELLGLVASVRGRPISVVARPADNPALEAELLRLRSRFGNRVIYKKAALKEALKELKTGGVVAALIDQNVASKEGVFVEFFGRLACTSPILALLALKTSAPVVPAFALRMPEGKYRVVVEPPVEIERTGNLDRDVVEATQKFTTIIEQYVRRYPDQWLWMHRRWKTRPHRAEVEG
jgi:KDO2-lipid IV(A) lauroyltransferase